MNQLATKYVCICDRKKPELAATIISYLGEKESYFPLFEFPYVSSDQKDVAPDAINEDSMSIQRAEGTVITINNAIARMGGCELLIFAGLSKEQKSFLGRWEKRNHIFIDEAEEIDFYLSSHSDKKESLSCRPTDLMKGLYVALQTDKLLRVDEAAEDIICELYASKQLVIAEDDHSVAALSAVLYASASGSDIQIVPALLPPELTQVFESIKAWRKVSAIAYEVLEDMVRSRLNDIDIEKYSNATFFTIGLPYSLILKNVIPLSYVHLHARPDLFVLNCLLWENKQKFGSAIIFSPELFKNEETDHVIQHLESHGHYVKSLLGKEATVYNLHMNLKEFPFDLLHLCSHGGEIKGSRLRLRFKDEEAAEHVVEFESVLSLAAVPGTVEFMVHHKWFPKLLDGLEWGSKELKEKNLSQAIKRSMHQAISDAQAKDKEILEKEVVVTNSTSIQCNDDNYQAMIQLMASQTSPLIFNNTCWSWYHIAKEFLHGGARGYIGCLWNVGNTDAVHFADTFYDEIFSGRVIDAFYAAGKSIEGRESEHVYLYWGLPITSLQPTELKEARHRVMVQLKETYLRYEQNLGKTKHEKMKDAIKKIMEWIKQKIMSRFKEEFIADRQRIQALLEERKRKAT